MPSGRDGFGRFRGSLNDFGSVMASTEVITVSQAAEALGGCARGSGKRTTFAG